MKEGPSEQRLSAATADTWWPVGLVHRDVSPHTHRPPPPHPRACPHPEGRTVICTESPRFNLCLCLAQCLVSRPALVSRRPRPLLSILCEKLSGWGVGGVQLGERP